MLKTKPISHPKPLSRFFAAVYFSAVAFATLATLSTTARGQIYFGDTGSSTVREFSVSGAPLDVPPITGLHNPIGVAVSGTDVFVVNNGTGTVGQYTTAGETVNASLITGLNGPTSIAVSGSNLFIANNGNGTISKYTTAGAIVSGTLVSGLNGPWGLAVSGSNLFVTNWSSGTVGQYTTSGAAVNGALISSLNGPWGIAVSGTTLFVTNINNGTVGKYTTAGAAVNPALVSGFSFSAGIAVSGSDLFVTDNSGGTVGQFTTAGAVVNASLIADSSGPWGIAVVADNSVVLDGNKAAGIANGTFNKIGQPAMNNVGHVAFQATVTGFGVHTRDNSGIWADNTAGTRQLVVRTGTIAPGTSSALFRTLGDPVYNNHEAVAFIGTLLAGSGNATTSPINNTVGLWSTDGGTLHLVARSGTQPPGTLAGALFKKFLSFALPDQGGAVFLASLVIGHGSVNTANDTGIWAVDTGGTLRPIIREGDTLEGKTVTALAFMPAIVGVSGQTRGFNQGTGDLIYRATFDDGSTGIYEVVFP